MDKQLSQRKRQPDRPHRHHRIHADEYDAGSRARAQAIQQPRQKRRGRKFQLLPVGEQARGKQQQAKLRQAEKEKVQPDARPLCKRRILKCRTDRVHEQVIQRRMDVGDLVFIDVQIFVRMAFRREIIRKRLAADPRPGLGAQKGLLIRVRQPIGKELVDIKPVFPRADAHHQRQQRRQHHRKPDKRERRLSALLHISSSNTMFCF